jgi:hypothetical protein
MNYRPLLACLAVLAPSLNAQTDGSISTPASRDALVASASRLATAETPASVSSSLGIDPFSPPAANLRWEVTPENGPRASALSDAQLAEVLIAAIQPTGSMLLGGEPYLLFTERRQKIGDKLVVSVDKVEYTVEIVSIANNRFRIRYNGQEAERPIK